MGCGLSCSHCNIWIVTSGFVLVPPSSSFFTWRLWPNHCFGLHHIFAFYHQILMAFIFTGTLLRLSKKCTDRPCPCSIHECLYPIQFVYPVKCFGNKRRTSTRPQFIMCELSLNLNKFQNSGPVFQ